MSPYVLSEFPPKNYALWWEQDPHPLIIFIIHPPEKKKDGCVGFVRFFFKGKKKQCFFWCTWKSICYEFAATLPLKPAIQLLEILGTFLRFPGSSSFTKNPSTPIFQKISLWQFFSMPWIAPPQAVTISSHLGPCNKSDNLFCSY